MTNISELKAGQGNVDVQGVIKEIGEPRTFNKFGRELSVANAVLEDDSGSVKLTLWNDDIGKFKVGDVVKITNGYVNEFQGEAQLTSGKFGQMEKVGEGEVSATDSPEQTELVSDEAGESAESETAGSEPSEEPTESEAEESEEVAGEEESAGAGESEEESAEESSEEPAEAEEKPAEEESAEKSEVDY